MSETVLVVPFRKIGKLLHVTVHCVTLNLLLSCLSDAGSLRECGQLAVEQLPVNRPSPGQVG